MTSSGRSTGPSGRSGDGADLPRAWGWVAHLRAGGTTPWLEWRGTAEPWGPVLPGAQQLELLRRLNRERTVPAALADRILVTSTAGRGLPDLDLVGAKVTAYGPPPIDPADLPADELLRVATMLLAEQLTTGGHLEADQEHPDGDRSLLGTLRRLPRPGRRRYRLVGDPLLSDPVRQALRDRGHPPRPRGEVVLWADELGRMLSHAWIDACLRGDGVAPWPEWVAHWRRQRRLPTRIDLPVQAALWARRRGAEHVHVVTDRSTVAALVGVRRLPEPPAPPGAVAADLARRLVPVLGLVVPPEQRGRVLRERLLPALPAEAFGWQQGPAVPAEHAEWLRQRSRRIARRLRRGGYAETPTPRAMGWHPPDEVSPASDASRGMIDPAAVLALAGRLLREDGPRTPGTGDAPDTEAVVSAR